MPRCGAAVLLEGMAAREPATVPGNATLEKGRENG